MLNQAFIALLAILYPTRGTTTWEELKVLTLTSTDHPPDVRNDADAKHAGSPLEIRDGELGSRSVPGASIGILDLDGARFQHGNEGLDS